MYQKSREELARRLEQSRRLAADTTDEKTQKRLLALTQDLEQQLKSLE
jgi:hypothetical protein